MSHIAFRQSLAGVSLLYQHPDYDVSGDVGGTRLCRCARSFFSSLGLPRTQQTRKD
jgi:hypothetical protein